MATPAAVAANYSQAVVSTLDIYKPENLATLYRKRGDQGLMAFDFYRSLGYILPTAATEYSHYEDDFIHEVFHVRVNVASPGAGANQLITVAVADLDAGNRFYPRLKDEVRYKTGEVGVIIVRDVTVPGAPILTIRPVRANITLPAVTAGETITIISGAKSEGSGQGISALSKTNKYTNRTQIIFEKVEATGTEMTNQDWFDKLDNGASIPVYFFKAIMDMDYRINLKMSGALVYGEKSTTGYVTDPDTGLSIETTEGLIPYIQSNGQNISYTPGLFSVNHFDEVTRRLDKEFASLDTLVLAGHDFLTEKDNVLVDYNKNTNISYTSSRMRKAYLQDNEGLDMAVGFSYLTKSNRHFAFAKMGMFSNPKLGGASGFKDSSLALFCPLGKKKMKYSQEDTPFIGMRYKAKGNHNRMLQLWKFGAAGANVNEFQGEDDKQAVNVRADIGAHNACGNQFVRLYAA
jgi:hypothetical protein